MKKRFSSWIGLLLIVSTAACVDPINFDVGKALVFPIVVEGSITNEPGPYEIVVSRTFDLETQAAVREGIAVKRVEISDNLGNSEVLKQHETGIYRTRPDGIRGVIGRAYKLKVETFDGRIYETVPDTMQQTGSVSNIDHEIVEYVNDEGIPEHGFDIFFDAAADEQKSFQFMWKLVMTYQISTNPEDHMKLIYNPACPNPLDCYYPDPLVCSGYIWNDSTGFIDRVGPCECCQCWMELRNELPVMSDNEFVKNGIFKKVKAGRLPITGRTMQYKTHVEVQQYTLSTTAYNFWKAIKAQKEATTSLFQPLSGQITGNFEQVEGETAPIEGLFYASSVGKYSIYLSRDNIPDINMIPPIGDQYTGACTDFIGATARRPAFWTP